MPSEAHSPIGSLIQYLPGSLVRVAPERESELAGKSLGVFLAPIPGPGFPFGAVVPDRAILVSWRGLEYLWALSYSAWVLLRLHNDIGFSQANADLTASNRTSAIPPLLRWASDNQVTDDYSPWPTGLPTPTVWDDSTGLDPTDIEVATEVALVACAWILHHELAHINRAHLPGFVDSIQNEIQADDDATAWILDQAPAEALLKRGTGIAVATVAAAALELYAAPALGTVRDHPHPSTRIQAALSHPKLATMDAVHHTAAIQLGIHLKEAGIIPSGTAFDCAQDALTHYCIEYARSGR